MKGFAKKIGPTSVVNWVFDNTSIIYPNELNNYHSLGPRFGQVRGLRMVGRIPILGSTLKKIPLPGGIRVNLLQGQSYKLTAIATSEPNGNWTATLNFSGTHNLFGSK